MAALLASISMLFWGVWAIFEKKVSLTGNVFWNNVYYSAAAMTLFPLHLALAKKYGGPFQWNWETVGWSYAALLASSAAGFVYMYLLAKQPAGWTTAFTAAYPLVTILLAALFLGEALTAKMAIGAVFVAVGLVILGL